jgi:hypothetical protein
MVRKSYGMREGCCWNDSSERAWVRQPLSGYLRLLLLLARQITSHLIVNNRSTSVFWVRRRSSVSIKASRFSMILSST